MKNIKDGSIMKDVEKNFKDIAYECLSEPTKEKFTDLMMHHVGEQDNLDFKAEWIEDSKLAKIILAMANGGAGIIVIGVKEEGDKNLPVGIETFLDKADIENRVGKFLPKTVEYEVYDLDYDTADYKKLEGKKFQIILVHGIAERLPYVSLMQGKYIEKDTIYVRRGTQSVRANNDELQRILNMRIDTMYSSTSELQLYEHLEQLKLLYKQIDKYNYIINSKEGTPISGIALAMSQIGTTFFSKTQKTKNPLYPNEDYEEFISRMIREKKSKIEKVLDLK